MRTPEVFKELAAKLAAEKVKPTYLKIPPPTSAEDEQNLAKLVRLWADEGMDGVTAVNTMPVEAPELALRRGGLSGRPLKSLMLRAVAMVRREVGDGFEVHAVGGIMTGRDAYEAIKAGADTVQIMTAMLYRGAMAPAKIARELLEVAKTG